MSKEDRQSPIVRFASEYRVPNTQGQSGASRPNVSRRVWLHEARQLGHYNALIARSCKNRA